MTKRNSIGQFTSGIMYRMTKSFKRFVLGMESVIKGYIAIGSVMVAAYILILIGMAMPRDIAQAQVIDHSDARYVAKIEALKDAVVTDIGHNCESRGRKTLTDPVIILDTNNRASIGIMQWQVSSVISYYKTLYKRDLSAKEAVMIALDDQKAMALAKDVMFLTKNKASKDWYTCSQRMNADERIDIIKSL